MKDVPIEILFERIDRIRATYGAGVSVQVTGGDPTLRDAGGARRDRERVAEKDLRPSLFTNGIKATRDLLAELAAAGLFDVAFHVDTTQRRKRFPTEESLNPFAANTSSAPAASAIAVIFNTPSTAGTSTRSRGSSGSFSTTPTSSGWPRSRCTRRRAAASGAARAGGHGAGDPRAHPAAGGEERARVERGAPRPPGLPRGHDARDVRRPRRWTSSRTSPSYESFLEEMKHVPFDRRDVAGRRGVVLLALARRPWWLPRGGAFVLSRALAGPARALAREEDRQDHVLHPELHGRGRPRRGAARNCSFMVMTDDGPVSMCAHNARRDDYILKPLALPSAGGAGVWDPRTGALALSARPAARAS